RVRRVEVRRVEASPLLAEREEPVEVRVDRVGVDESGDDLVALCFATRIAALLFHPWEGLHAALRVVGDLEDRVHCDCRLVAVPTYAGEISTGFVSEEAAKVATLDEVRV